MRKTIRSLPIIALALGIYFLLACNKKQVVVEEPRVENCLKVRYLGVGCKRAFFETLDTTKFKGTFVESWDGTDKVFFPIFNNLRVFVNYREDTLLSKKLIVGQTYFVEYQVVKEKLKPFDVRKCFPDPSYFEQLIIENILTSNCTKKQ